MKLGSKNKKWFSRENAFEYLKQDKDNILRIKKILEVLTDYRTEKEQKALDIGCGNGIVGSKIKKIGYKVYGIDISKSNVSAAKKNGIIASVGDASNKLPYQNNFFDAVYAGEIIEHLYDTEKFLKEIHRVLKPNGLLVITTPNLAHLPDRIKFLFGISPSQIQPLHPFLKMHIRPFTFDVIYGALDANNFKKISFESTYVVFKRDLANPDRILIYSRLLAGLFPRFGSCLIVSATKI